MTWMNFIAGFCCGTGVSLTLVGTFRYCALAEAVRCETRQECQPPQVLHLEPATDEELAEAARGLEEAWEYWEKFDRQEEKEGLR
ncbi:MAG: hypothetical protein Q4C70_01420 [Planctomycetia bacterium]|nr:hypothetical protein [Planctomycetia bacterium]